jgi:hypothetical protein
MKAFVFSSQSLTNIWAGIGAGMWAVSKRTDKGMKELHTKAAGMPVGSLGLMYWSSGQAFTTPFVVKSSPNASRVVTDVWPEEWVMPFDIAPLGSPRRRVHKDRVAAELSAFQDLNTTNITKVFRLAPTQVFVPTELSDSDWEWLFSELAGS